MSSRIKMIHSFMEDLHALHLPMSSRLERLGEYAFTQANAQYFFCPNCSRKSNMIAKDFAQFNFPYLSPAIKEILLVESKHKAYSFPEIHYNVITGAERNNVVLPSLFNYLQYNHEHTLVRPKHVETYEHYMHVFSRSPFYDPAFIEAIYVKASYFKPNGTALVHPAISAGALNTYYCSECRDDEFISLSPDTLKDLLNIKKYGRVDKMSIFKEPIQTNDPTLLKQLYSYMAVAMAFSLSFGRDIRVVRTPEMHQIEAYLRFHKPLLPTTTL